MVCSANLFKHVGWLESEKFSGYLGGVMQSSREEGEVLPWNWRSRGGRDEEDRCKILDC
jgi:hypothetical protein